MAPASPRRLLPLHPQLVLLSRISLIVLASCLSLAASWAGASPPAGDRVVARLYFGSQDTLNALAGQLDVWEVNRHEGYAVIGLRREDLAVLRSRGLHVEIDTARTMTRGAPLDLSCYRSVEAVQAELQALATAHPSLVELIDYGDSWDKVQSNGSAGYDLWVLKLTNRALSGTKPRFFLMGEIHSRELAVPETALALVHTLLDNYGVDPDVTWLLDYHEIHVAPMTNPDGHKLAEQGLLWRKNTNNTDGCTSYPDYGTDLNRNADFKWDGCSTCASTEPCAETYRGSGPGSEPETQALQNYIQGLFPDQRGPDDTDPAPEDTTGIMISLHSYGNLVLWPWGHTDQPAPNSAGLAAIGQKLATFNEYAASQASHGLYLTSGTTDDYTYGQLGVPGYTLEIGEAFFQDCADLPGIIAENRDALLYAAKIARTPYLTARGPDTRDATLGSAPPGQPGKVVLTVQIDDTQNGNQAIAAGEATLDKPVWAGGTPVSLEPADGAFDSPIETAVAMLDPTGLGSGRHTVFVRGQDEAGYWGPLTSLFFSTPLYLQLAFFHGVAADNTVTLHWATEAEIGVEGFNILRGQRPRGSKDDVQYAKLNETLIPAQGSSMGAHYTFVDAGVARGVTYLYILEDVDTSGYATQHGPIEVTPGSIYLPLFLSTARK